MAGTPLPASAFPPTGNSLSAEPPTDFPVTSDSRSQPPRSAPRRFLNRLEVDRATFYAVCSRAWQFLGGPVTWFLIALYFSKETQDFYYTFASLMALQWFVELSLHTVVIHVASHEWAQLEFVPGVGVRGDSAAHSRLSSLVRFVVVWYTVVAIVFVIAVGITGYAFLSTREGVAVEWTGPWAGLVLVTGALIWTLPFAALLEGCNQVTAVNRYRLIQAVVGSVVVWICITTGGNLWAVAASTLARLIVELILLAGPYREFFTSLLRQRGEAQIDWRVEIWPLQWRLGVQGILRYVAYYLFTPVMFYYHGEGTAGRMGMTWSVLTALQMATLAWVQTRTSLFGTLVAKRDWQELDRVFFRLTAISSAVIFLGGTTFCAFLAALTMIDHRVASLLADRVLPLESAWMFVAAIVLLHIPNCMSVYMLAHKENPIFRISIVANCAIGLAVWLMGREWGASGAGAGLLLIVVAVNVPGWSWVWYTTRKRWHGDGKAA